MAEGTPEEQRAKGERALKVFLETQSKVSLSTEKMAKASDVLAKTIGDNNQGLVAVIADLIDELAAHREEMKLFRAALLKAGGVNVDLGSILGGGRRERR